MRDAWETDLELRKLAKTYQEHRIAVVRLYYECRAAIWESIGTVLSIVPSVE